MMGFLSKIRLLWHVFVHEEAPWSVKLLMLAAFFYIIFPLDIFPDNILLAGWLDDLALAVVMYILAMKMTPEELIKKIVDGLRRRDKEQD